MQNVLPKLVDYFELTFGQSNNGLKKSIKKWPLIDSVEAGCNYECNGFVEGSKAISNHIYSTSIPDALFKIEEVFIKSLKLYELIIKFLKFSIISDYTENLIASEIIDTIKLEFVLKSSKNVMENAKLFIEIFKLIKDIFDSKILPNFELNEIDYQSNFLSTQNNESYEINYERFTENYRSCEIFFDLMLIRLKDFKNRELLFLNHSHNCEEQFDDGRLNSIEKDEFENQEKKCSHNSPSMLSDRAASFSPPQITFTMSF